APGCDRSRRPRTGELRSSRQSDRWPWLPEQAQLRRLQRATGGGDQVFAQLQSIPVGAGGQTGTADEMARPPGGNAELLQGVPADALEASGADGVVRPLVPVRPPAAAG